MDHYTSRVEELSQEFLFLGVPLHHQNHTAMNVVNTSLWIDYQAEDGTLCRFSTHRVEVENIPIPVWKIPRPKTSDIVRDQRREFVRVTADLPIRLEVMQGGAAVSHDIYSRDISGGGLAILVPRKLVLSAGMQVRARFALPNPDVVIDAACFIVRVGDRNERGYAVASMQFLNLKETVRQRIIQYVFWRQRSARR